MKEQKALKGRHRLVVTTKKPTAENKDQKITVLRPEVRVLDDRMLLPRHIIAAAFSVTADTVGKWAVYPVIKRGTESLYYLPEVVDYRGGSDGTPKLNPAQEKALLDKTRRENAQLDLERKRGLLVSTEDAAKEWESQIITIRQKLLSIPARVARPLAALTKPAEIQEYVYNEICKAMDDLNHEATIEIGRIENAPESEEPAETESS